jgi:homopolymeric O-antigen transport system ATP-binding protein
MNEIPIRVQDLSKKYKIDSGTRHNTLRDEIAHGFKSLLGLDGRRSTLPAQSDSSDAFWALKDVSFEVKKGEVLGIIGRNGAGKSTLLKILSRITEPTEGKATIHGRVGSLLEVGTGFHSELTGRENVYLNGAILGMKKTEIDRKFDEIVAFAEVEKFIDNPVKRYSSGMQMRLAFAVAAHLEPEILIIDEVLAVGDARFQKRCTGKIEDVAGEGRTVLFVSHNMSAIANLCQSAILLENGQLVSRGDVGPIVSEYLKSGGLESARSGDWNHHGTGEAQFTAVRLLDSDGLPRETFRMGETVVVDIATQFFSALAGIYMSVDIKRTETGLNVVHLTSEDSGFNPEIISAGAHRFTVEMPNCWLYPGSYKISLSLEAQNTRTDYIQDVLSFSIVKSGDTKRIRPFYDHLGVYHAPSIWREGHLASESGTASPHIRNYRSLSRQ